MTSRRHAIAASSAVRDHSSLDVAHAVHVASNAAYTIQQQQHMAVRGALMKLPRVAAECAKGEQDLKELQAASQATRATCGTSSRRRRTTRGAA